MGLPSLCVTSRSARLKVFHYLLKVSTIWILTTLHGYSPHALITLSPKLSAVETGSSYSCSALHIKGKATIAWLWKTPQTGQSTEFISRRSVLFIWQAGAVQAHCKSPAMKAAVRNTPLPLWLSGKQRERKRALRFPNPAKATLCLLDAVIAKEEGAPPVQKKNFLNKIREEEEKKSHLEGKALYCIDVLDSFFDLMLTLILYNSGGVNGATHFPSPSKDLGRATATQCWHWELLCLGALDSCRTQGSRGSHEGQPHNTHKTPPKYTCVYLY